MSAILKALLWVLMLPIKLLMLPLTVVGFMQKIFAALLIIAVAVLVVVVIILSTLRLRTEIARRCFIRASQSP